MDAMILVFVLGVGTGIFGFHWKPFAFLYPKPDMAALTQAQSALVQAKADAAAKEAALAQVHDAEHATAGECVKAMKWGINHKDLVKFGDLWGL